MQKYCPSAASKHAVSLMDQKTLKIVMYLIHIRPVKNGILI
jgi:hypothetical protein